jgi:hypothetical protein
MYACITVCERPVLVTPWCKLVGALLASGTHAHDEVIPLREEPGCVTHRSFGAIPVGGTRPVAHVIASGDGRIKYPSEPLIQSPGSAGPGVDGSAKTIGQVDSSQERLWEM